ncbi:hypothetical protein C8Q77DRAFT_1072518 [Trametes polyzona]|nr:hypothetical protein C8Q77DRAFT_1072518 [Trametes polyzona]
MSTNSPACIPCTVERKHCGRERPQCSRCRIYGVVCQYVLSSAENVNMPANPQVSSARLSQGVAHRQFCEPCHREGLISHVRMGIFLEHASQLGLFIDRVDHFAATAPRPLNPSGPLNSDRPLREAFLYAAYLWGIRLSTANADQRTQEFRRYAFPLASVVLERYSPTMCTEDDSLFSLQTCVLLAHYAFSGGDIVEGRRLCQLAVAHVRHRSYHRLQFTTLYSQQRYSPAFIQMMIDGYWTFWALDQAWSAVLDQEPCTHEFDSTTVASWPNALRATYTQSAYASLPRLDPPFTVLGYVQNLMAQQKPKREPREGSPLATRLKAVALFKEACRLVKESSHVVAPGHEARARYTTANRLAEAMKSRLSSPEFEADEDDPQALAVELLVDRTFLYAGLMRLQVILVPSSGTLSQASVYYARRTVEDALDSRAERPYPDPIMAQLAIMKMVLILRQRLWTDACRILQQEPIGRGPRAPTARSNQDALNQMIARIALLTTV